MSNRLLLGLAALTRRRAGLAALSLLLSLGALAMHATPATGSAPWDQGSPGGSVTRLSLDDLSAAAPSERATPGSPAGEHHDNSPARHHLLAPCVSEGGRSGQLTGSPIPGPVVGLAALVVPPTPSRCPLPLSRALSPPDLQMLCICRT